jgi:hypothetical protein
MSAGYSPYFAALGFPTDARALTSAAMSTNPHPVESTRARWISSALRNTVKRAAQPVLVRGERWVSRRIVETVREELAETREELRADLATLVELTVELERIAERLEANDAPEQT